MSWQQLLTIARQNEEWDRYWRAQQPRACPNDEFDVALRPPGTVALLGCRSGRRTQDRGGKQEPGEQSLRVHMASMGTRGDIARHKRILPRR